MLRAAHEISHSPLARPRIAGKPYAQSPTAFPIAPVLR